MPRQMIWSWNSFSQLIAGGYILKAAILHIFRRQVSWFKTIQGVHTEISRLTLVLPNPFLPIRRNKSEKIKVKKTTFY